jgi:hypothetical protein
VSVLKVMTSTNFDIKSEIKTWLKAALKKETLTDIVVNEVELHKNIMVIWET